MAVHNFPQPGDPGAGGVRPGDAIRKERDPAVQAMIENMVNQIIRGEGADLKQKIFSPMQARNNRVGQADLLQITQWKQEERWGASDNDIKEILKQHPEKRYVIGPGERGESWRVGVKVGEHTITRDIKKAQFAKWMKLTPEQIRSAFMELHSMASLLQEGRLVTSPKQIVEILKQQPETKYVVRPSGSDPTIYCVYMKVGEIIHEVRCKKEDFTQNLLNRLSPDEMCATVITQQMKPIFLKEGRWADSPEKATELLKNPAHQYVIRQSQSYPLFWAVCVKVGNETHQIPCRKTEFAVLYSHCTPEQIRNYLHNQVKEVQPDYEEVVSRIQGTTRLERLQSAQKLEEISKLLKTSLEDRTKEEKATSLKILGKILEIPPESDKLKHEIRQLLLKVHPDRHPDKKELFTFLVGLRTLACEDPREKREKEEPPAAPLPPETD